MSPSSTMRACALLVLLVLTGCSTTDDGATVRVLGTEPDASGATGTGSAVADVTCTPVNPELEADAAQQVAITAIDYAYEPDVVQVPAGVTTFAMVNDGTVNHELAFLPGGGEIPLLPDGAPDEGALEAAGAFELEGFSPGQTCNATYDLEPGTYTLFCVIATQDGRTHYELGMEGQLTVS